MTTEEELFQPEQEAGAKKKKRVKSDSEKEVLRPGDKHIDTVYEQEAVQRIELYQEFFGRKVRGEQLRQEHRFYRWFAEIFARIKSGEDKKQAEAVTLTVSWINPKTDEQRIKQELLDIVMRTRRAYDDLSLKEQDKLIIEAILAYQEKDVVWRMPILPLL